MGLMMYKMWANFESFLHLHCFISVSESVSLSHRRLPWPPCWFLYLLTLIVNTAWSTVLLREEIVRIFEFSTLFRLPFFVNEERQCCLCVIGWFVFSCCKKNCLWSYYSKEWNCVLWYAELGTEIVCCCRCNLPKLKLSVTWKWLLLYS